MKVVIVGNGVAGVIAARAIRESQPEAQIELYAEEDCHYYPRPQLIELLAGRASAEQVFLYDERWYRERGIAVHLASRVEELAPERGEIRLADGKRAGYDSLLLATGARPALPEIPGIDQDGVLTLRTLRDALRLKAKVGTAKEIVVLGSGLLGLETACALASSAGVRAHVLEREGWPLSRQLDRQGGELLMEWLHARGVEVVTEAQCAAILEGAGGVELADGRTLTGGLVLATTGVRPNCELGQEAGLKTERGVIVDEHLRTSAPEVYAAGDVAEFRGRAYGIIPAAIEQAQVAALNIVGQEATYKGTVPSNTLKVSGLDLFSAGEVNPQGDGYQDRSWRSTASRSTLQDRSWRSTPSGSPLEEVRLLDRDRGVYKKLVFSGGRLVGAILLGTKKNAVHFAQLIAGGQDLAGYKEELLADDFDFKGL